MYQKIPIPKQTKIAEGHERLAQYASVRSKHLFYRVQIPEEEAKLGEF